MWGSATFTMVTSSTTMSWAPAITRRATAGLTRRRGAPGIELTVGWRFERCEFMTAGYTQPLRYVNCFVDTTELSRRLDRRGTLMNVSTKAGQEAWRMI